MQNFRLSTAQVKFHQNLYFDRLLLLKVYKVSAKKMEELCLMIPNSGAKYEEKHIFSFKIDKNLANFNQKN